MEQCGECEFVYDLSGPEELGPRIIEAASQLSSLVAVAQNPALRRSPEKWSPLEYACHVRDVLLVQRERVLVARRSVRPSFEPMGRDDRVEHDGYADQRVSDVRRQLDDAALMFGQVLGRLELADWERTVIYNYPAAQERSLAWVAVHTLHELVHHRADIMSQLP